MKITEFYMKFLFKMKKAREFWRMYITWCNFFEAKYKELRK